MNPTSRVSPRGRKGVSRRRIVLSLLASLAGASALFAQLTVSGQLTRGAQPAVGVGASITARLAPTPEAEAFERLPPAAPATPSATPRVEARARGDGRFALEVPSPGVWRLEVDAGDGAMLAFDIPVVESRDLGAVDLPPLGRIEVHVRDTEGKPLAGARVALASSGAPTFSTGRHFEPALIGPIALTDEEGIARLSHKADRRSPDRVVVLADDRAPLAAPAKRARLDVRLSAGVPSVWRLLEPSRAPAAGSVALLSGLPLAVADEEGVLRLAVPRDGLLRVELVSPSGARRLGPLAPAPLAPAQDGEAAPKPADIVLEAPVEVTGTVVTAEDSQPLGAALVHGHGHFTTTDASGGFRLLLPSLDPMMYPRLWLAAAARGRLPASKGDVFPTRGAPSAVRLELEAGVAVSGTVVSKADGLPVTRATITAGRETSSASDEQGAFRLRATLGDLQHVRVRHPDFAPLELSIGPSELPPQQPSVRIELEVGRTAVGWVVDPEDRPVRGAEVDLWTHGANRRSERVAPASATTDDGGAFRLERLAAGSYDLEVTAPAFVVARVPGLEIEGESGGLELGTVALDRAARLDVLVTDPDGRPLEGVRVSYHRADETLRRRLEFGPPASEETGSDGRVLIDHLAPGEAIQVSAGRTGFVSANARVEPPTLEPLLLVLEPGFEISGTVRSMEGEAIADTRVQTEPIRAGTSRWTQSDPSGRFLLSGLAAGEYRLSASATGFLPERTEEIVLGDGPEAEPVDIRLSPGATLEGRVVDADGRAIEGATISPRLEQRVRGPSPRGRSDSDGHYRVEGLPLGAVTVGVDGSGHRGVVRDLELESGVNRHDFELTSALEISGRVLGPDGQPVAEADVFLRGPADRVLGFARTGVDGTFTREVDDHTVVRLGARKSDVGASTEVGPIAVEGASVSGIELRLEGGGAISGQIHGLEVDDLSRARIVASPAHQQNPWSRTRATPDYEGRFRIESLVPGEWLVTADFDNRSARASAIVTDASSEVTVDLVFEPGLTLSGLVLDGGEPVEAATVRANGADVVANGTDVTGSEGRFAIDDLPPGSYRIDVQTSRRGGARHQETVELDTDREIVIELPGGRVSGTVVDGDGAPVADAAVELQQADAPLRSSPLIFQRSSAQGSFEFERVSSGRWMVTARRDEGLPAQLEIEVDDLGVDGLRLELPSDPDDPTELYLLSADGQLLRSASLVLAAPGGSTSLRRHYVVREGGRIVLDDVPPGRWLAAIQAGPLIAELELTVPAKPRRVLLEAPAFVEVVAPELVGTGTIRPLDITRSPPSPLDGLWLDSLRQPQLVDGRTTIGPIPAGFWRLAVELEPGRVVEKGVQALGNARTRVEIE